jgi:hypothetical protein
MTTSEITFERHFPVEELSALWGMSDDFTGALSDKGSSVNAVWRHSLNAG